MGVPVEVTTKYVTSVDTIADAWAFVMSRIDDVGPEPSVSIRPFSSIGVADIIDGLEDQGGEGWARRFEVVVEGMVHEPTTTEGTD